MWNNLRARHYSILILLAIITLETSAIAIDRFINQESETAFAIESPFQNNPFIQSFRIAETSTIEEVKIVRKISRATPTSLKVVESVDVNAASAFAHSVSVEFIAASSEKENISKYIEYSVQPGDSLSNIADLFGSKTATIKQANKIEDQNTIRAGQTLKVPLPSNEIVYTIRKGDSLSRIANRFCIPLKSLIEENNLKSHILMADQRIKIPIKRDVPSMETLDKSVIASSQSQKTVLANREKSGLLPSKSRSELIKAAISGKIQLVQIQTPALASKPHLDSIKAELLKHPPVIRKSVAVKAQIKDSAKPYMKIKAGLIEVKKEKIKTSYIVVRGDSLLKIAHKYNTTVAQIQSDNRINGTVVKVGQKLVIQPNKKLYRIVKSSKSTKTKTVILKHKVVKGESLSVIARRYGTSIKEIIRENNFSSTVVMAGQTIKVPSTKGKGYKVKQSRSFVTKSAFRMPVRGRLSSKFGWRRHPIRRKRLFHAGVDLAALKGTPITASNSGKVTFSGYRSGYGKIVMISHSNGYSTRYAHCSSLLVKKGQTVKTGQLIARVGSTGASTGNHLHFEIRKNGKPQNPFNYVK